MNSLTKYVIEISLLSAIGFSTVVGTYAETIKLYDTNKAQIEFPQYLGDLSITIRHLLADQQPEKNAGIKIEEIPLPISTSYETWITLKKYIEYLPEAARDIEGQPVETKDIRQETLYVNRLVKSAIQSELSQENPTQVSNLYVLSNYLQIHPLFNAIASVLADRIYPQVIKNEIAILENEKKHTHLDENGVRILAIRQALAQKEYTVELSDELIFKISKHIEYRRLNVSENTVQDYIASYGHPFMSEIKKKVMVNNNGRTVVKEITGKKLDLSKKKLTSLEGLHLIRNAKDVLEINLDRNCLFGPNLNSDFPETPFTPFSQLRSLLIERCHLTMLPSHFLQGLPMLQLLSLKGNKLKEVKGELNGLPQLKWLYLNENKIQEIHLTAFSDQNQLRRLYLDHNRLTSLPENLFNNLNDLSVLSVNDNELSESQEQFKQKYLNGKNLTLYTDPFDLAESDLLRSVQTHK